MIGVMPDPMDVPSARRQTDAVGYISTAVSLAEQQLANLNSAARSDISQEEWLRVLARHGVLDERLRRLTKQASRLLGLPPGPKERILAYLRLRRGQVVTKEELSGVSGIFEWARRIRELRVEDGWPILSSKTSMRLRPGEYLLEADTADPQASREWQTANRIRRQPGSGSSRILALFLESVGQRVSKEQLQYVAKIQEHPRRVRELVEAGWQIESHLDRADLGPGEYILATTERRPPRAREHIKLRYRIFDRDKYECVVCHQSGGMGTRLQVHHLLPVAQGGKNDEANLETLCDACHAGKHAMLRTKVQDELLHPEDETDLASEAGPS
jgi:hypothetical protein